MAMPVVSVVVNIGDELVIISVLAMKTASSSLVHETVTVASAHVPLHDTLTEQLKVTTSLSPTVKVGEAGSEDILTESIVKPAIAKHNKTDYMYHG